MWASGDYASMVETLLLPLGLGAGTVVDVAAGGARTRSGGLAPVGRLGLGGVAGEPLGELRDEAVERAPHEPTRARDLRVERDRPADPRAAGHRLEVDVTAVVADRQARRVRVREAGGGAEPVPAGDAGPAPPAERGR